MSWKQYVREQKQLQKAAALEHARDEAARYEAYVELLTKLHAQCGPPRNWQAISQTPPPSEPVRVTTQEEAASRALSDFNPGFFARLFGGKQKRLELEAAVGYARAVEARNHEAKLELYRRALGDWQEQVRLAPGVMRLDLGSCREAMSYFRAFAEIEALRTRVSLVSINGSSATVRCEIGDADLVPTEETKLTAGGKLSTKDMPVGKYWLLVQDHVCSCAIRIARETFAMLPVDRIALSVIMPILNSSTGHIEPVCVLAAHFTPYSLGRLRFDSIDPSDSMKNFNHRMKFKKTSGFDPVEPASHEENWVET